MMKAVTAQQCYTQSDKTVVVVHKSRGFIEYHSKKVLWRYLQQLQEGKGARALRGGGGEGNNAPKRAVRPITCHGST